MKNLFLSVLLITTSIAFAQNSKPQVTVSKMTDAEYKTLSNAADQMQKAAEAYRKAADAYQITKTDILGKYNALDDQPACGHNRKIVDIREQYIIVEIDPPNTTFFDSLTNPCAITLSPGGETGIVVTN